MTCASSIAAICSLLLSPPDIGDIPNLTEIFTDEKPTKPIEERIKTPPSVELYSWSYGSTERSWFQWVSATVALNSSLEGSGWRMRAIGGIGGYSYAIRGRDAVNVLADAVGITDPFLPYLDEVGKYHGLERFAGAQIGYSVVEKNWELSGYLGVGVTNELYLSSNMVNSTVRIPPDVLLGLNATQLGLLGSLELAAYPSEELMLYASTIYTSALRWSYSEIKPGIALPINDILPKFITGKTYIGPHVALNTYDRDRQPMIGAHFTNMAIGPLYVSLAGGYTRDRHGGAYTILVS